MRNVYKQIEAANEKHRGFIERKEEQAKIEGREYEEDKKVLKAITEEIRKV